MGAGGDSGRRQRFDAQRNVVALVDAAKIVFADSGVDAPAKQITDRAGLGVGTLYRHFPLRSDLILAVLQHEIEECAQAAEALAATLGPWDALVRWIERFTAFLDTKRGLASALHSGDPAYGDLPQRLLDELETPLESLLTRAVDAGCARADVTARDILTTVALICRPVRGQLPGFTQRMTTVFLDGLKSGDPPAGAGRAKRGTARAAKAK